MVKSHEVIPWTDCVKKLARRKDLGKQEIFKRLECGREIHVLLAPRLELGVQPWDQETNVILLSGKSSC